MSDIKDYRETRLSSSTSSCDVSPSPPNASVEVVNLMHLLKSDNSILPKEIAAYLHELSHLDSRMIGQILGEPDTKSQNILYEYANSFQFASVSFDVALRVYLGRLELPREAQKIDRVLQAFAKAYYKSNPDSNECPSEDAVYTLAFSVLLLNTDAHNPRLARRFKMTKIDFIRNYHRLGEKGGSATAEVPDAYLGQCYDSFVTDAIKRIERKPTELLRDELELEFMDTALGLEIETSFDGRTAIVKKYTSDRHDYSSRRQIQSSNSSTASATTSSLFSPGGSFFKTGSSIFSTIFATADSEPELSIEGYVIVAVGNDSTRQIGYALTLYLLKTAPRPVLIRFCEPSVYCASLE
ncbi:ankyrin repeat-containing protein [Plasmopara halstedii]|uniref:Ankyrin repeat-containing protein n=1 Tax=Plasmopara halstedii TaxID=4781 RepID=A0A0P1AME9_PLAHL|nr:ankyrin repeat-containing protein [Plasmopara halstedii]CEG42238.1 ankyrin repeat-containing protein [Plasmopara halstedii]|eukprot:XP_024578607.1 ankyrin repeat-containing protein [Plasmopara halstedii]